MASPLNYSGWNSAELVRARQTAQAFLATNRLEIQTALAAQCKVLSDLIANFSSTALTFEDQLDCLAHIGDVAQMLRESAEGFFELGSQPVIAQTLGEGLPG